MHSVLFRSLQSGTGRRNFSMEAKSGYSESGFSLIDVFVTLTISIIFSGFAVLQLRSLNDTSDSTADNIVGFLREARIRALTGTLAYTVDVTNTNRLRARSSPLCSSSTKSTDASLMYQLP